MPHASLVRRAPIVTAGAFLVAIAYGISFPLLSIRLEATGVSGLLIGLNAAMPPLGWIVGAALLPLLQIGLGLPFKRLLQIVLLLGMGALIALRFADGYASMTVLRFLFGGAMGVLFRLFEFWINEVSSDAQRARTLASYNIIFMVGLIVGSSLQPLIGSQGWQAFAPPLLAMTGGLALFQLWSGQPTATVAKSVAPPVLGIVTAVPAALVVVLAYGVYEAAPTTLLQVYALREGLGEATAAHALTAAALGSLLLLYPVATLADRVGRAIPLAGCALVVVLASVAIPATLHLPSAFLASVAVMGGAATATYALALAMIGDRFSGESLVVANAAFGVVYAAGSVAGPLLDGMAMERFGNQGLLISIALVYAAATLVVVGRLAVQRERA